MSERPEPDETHSGAIADFTAQDEVVVSHIHWSDWPVLVVFWLLALVVFLQFFTRYVLNDSLGWTEEIARYLLIAVTFMGSILALRRGTHIAVEAVRNMMPPRLRAIMAYAEQVVSVTFFVLIAWITIKLAQRSSYQKMVSIELPKSVVYWGVAICLLFMAAIALWRFIDLVRHREHAKDARTGGRLV
ncbi:MAG: TRAP transporter small permease [Geminicoccaceae bacterium]